MALNDSHEDVSLSELEWIGMPFKVCKNHFEFDEVIINCQWMPDFVYARNAKLKFMLLWTAIRLRHVFSHTSQRTMEVAR